jgi:hypothetical protein
MSTEFNRGSKGTGFAQFLQGSIETGELNRAILDERSVSGGVYASPAAKKGLGTKAKTCKPTVNPCCKPTANTKPQCCEDKVKGTKEKTCKPTVNPCCKATANTKPECCDSKVEGTQTKTCKPTRNPCCKGNVEGTQTKTCKPTRNPCCKPPNAKKAQGSNEDFLGGAPVDRLFI